jgi:hypothetical protein
MYLRAGYSNHVRSCLERAGKSCTIVRVLPTSYGTRNTTGDGKLQSFFRLQTAAPAPSPQFRSISTSVQVKAAGAPLESSDAVKRVRVAPPHASSPLDAHAGAGPSSSGAQYLDPLSKTVMGSRELAQRGGYRGAVPELDKIPFATAFPGVSVCCCFLSAARA